MYSVLMNMNGILKMGMGINEYLSKEPKVKKQILDPLTTLLRLAILKHKPLGTKIGIHKNGIWMQPPDPLQGAIRWSFGEGRSDLHNLYEPIYVVCRWYDCETIKPILEMAVEGLENLKTVYRDGGNLVSHSISHYIDTLQTAIDEPQNIESVKLEAPWNSMWSPEEIDVVKKLLKFSEKDDSYIVALEAILSYKDTETRKITQTLIY